MFNSHTYLFHSPFCTYTLDLICIFWQRNCQQGSETWRLFGKTLMIFLGSGVFYNNANTKPNIWQLNLSWDGRLKGGIRSNNVPSSEMLHFWTCHIVCFHYPVLLMILTLELLSVGLNYEVGHLLSDLCWIWCRNFRCHISCNKFIIISKVSDRLITFFLKMWGKTVWIGKGLNRS